MLSYLEGPDDLCRAPSPLPALPSKTEIDSEKIRRIKFIEHMKPEEQYSEINMDTDSIVKKISKLNDDKIINIKNFSSKN